MLDRPFSTSKNIEKCIDDRIPALEAALEDLGRKLTSSASCGGKRPAMNDEVDATLCSFAQHVGESEALCKVLDSCALERHRGEIDGAFAGLGPEEGVDGIVRRLEGMGTEWAGKVGARVHGCREDAVVVNHPPIDRH